MGHRMALGGVGRRCELARDGPYRGAFRRNIYDVIVILYTTHIPRTQLAIFCKGAHA